MPDARAVRQAIHLLKILLGNLERFGGDVGDVLADEFGRIDAGAVDLLEQEAAEWFDTGSQESAVEGDVDAFEGNSSEAALEVDGFRFGFGLLDAFLDDFDQVGFYFFEGKGLRERLDVYFLSFEVIGNVGEAVECT